MDHFCHAAISVSCSLVVTCCERAGLWTLLFVMLSGVFVTFPFGVLGQLWYLTVSIPDLYLLPYLGVIEFLVGTERNITEIPSLVKIRLHSITLGI